VLRKQADLLEAFAIDKFVDAFTRRQLSGGVLLVETLLAATQLNALALLA